MIVKEHLRDGTLVKHYSDKGFVIEQVETGERYSEAIDGVPCPFTYIETDERIAQEGAADEQEISAEEALDIILGGEDI